MCELCAMLSANQISSMIENQLNSNGFFFSFDVDVIARQYGIVMPPEVILDGILDQVFDHPNADNFVGIVEKGQIGVFSKDLLNQAGISNKKIKDLGGQIIDFSYQKPPEIPQLTLEDVIMLDLVTSLGMPGLALF